MPKAYSRRICSNSSTLALLSMGPPVLDTSSHRVADLCETGGANSEYRKGPIQYIKLNKDLMLGVCTQEAENRYSENLRLNGTPVPGKPGVVSAPMYIFDNAAKQKQADLDDCYRRYGK